MEKEVKYARIFRDVCDNELIVEKWLRKHGGKQGDRWRSYFLGKYYTTVGYDQSDVGTVGDLLVEIFDLSLAFQFEIFKVGGRQRERISVDFDQYDDKFDIVEDDFVIDN